MATNGIEIQTGDTGAWARVEMIARTAKGGAHVAVWPRGMVILFVHLADGGNVQLQGVTEQVLVRWALIRETLAIETPMAGEVKEAISRGLDALTGKAA
jgi:hypothetical protein